MKKLFLALLFITSSASAMELTAVSSKLQILEPGKHPFIYNGTSLLVDNQEYPEITREELKKKKEYWDVCSSLSYLVCMVPLLTGIPSGILSLSVCSAGAGTSSLAIIPGIISLSSGVATIPGCLAASYGYYKSRQILNQEKELSSLLDLPEKPDSTFYTNVATTKLTLHDISTIKNLLAYIEGDEGRTDLLETIEESVAKLNCEKDNLKENDLIPVSSLARLAAAARLIAYSDFYEETIKLTTPIEAKTKKCDTITHITFELSPPADESIPAEKKHLLEDHTITIDGACAQALMAVQYPTELTVPYAKVLFRYN